MLKNQKIKNMPTHKNLLEGSISELIELNLQLLQINRRLEAQCGVSMVQWSLLKNLIARPAASPQVLAKALGITPGTLSQALSRLERRDLLFTCDDPSDARKKMISITRLGKEALDRAENIYKEAFFEMQPVNQELHDINILLKDRVKSRLAN
jgi:DNA-binding MarR family transcriptional regulator